MNSKVVYSALLLYMYCPMMSVLHLGGFSDWKYSGSKIILLCSGYR